MTKDRNMTYRLFFRDNQHGSQLANQHAHAINEREISNGRDALIQGINVDHQHRSALPHWYRGVPTLELLNAHGGSLTVWEGKHALSKLTTLSGIEEEEQQQQHNVVRVHMPTTTTSTAAGESSGAQQIKQQPFDMSAPDTRGVSTAHAFDANLLDVPFGDKEALHGDASDAEKATWSTVVKNPSNFFAEDFKLRQ